MSKEIKKETDWLGQEKWSIYENGIKVGEIKEETDWLGTKKQVIYDTSGNKICEMIEEIDIFGNKKLVTYDIYGKKISETEYETDWLGEQKEVIYENGVKIGELKKEKSIWGTEKKKLYEVNGYDVDLTTRTRRKKTKISNSSRGHFNLNNLSTYSFGNIFELILFGLVLVSIILLLVNPDYFKPLVLLSLALFLLIWILVYFFYLIFIISPLLLIIAICFPEAFPTHQERIAALILGIIPWLILLLAYILDIIPASATENFLKRILILASIGLILGCLIWLFSIIYHDHPKKVSITKSKVSAYRDANLNTHTKSPRLNSQKRERKLELKLMPTKPAKIFLKPKEKLKVIIIHPYSEFKENSLYKGFYEISYIIQGKMVKQKNIPVTKKKQVIEIENTNSSKVLVQIKYREYPARGLYFDPGIKFN